MNLKRVATAVAAGIIALMIPACGEYKADFDPAARYTPDSLAQELIFRFNDLKPEKRAGGRGKISAGAKASSEKAAAKAKEATKAAEANDLDALVGDIARKAAMVKGRSQADVIRTIGDLVGKDPGLSEPNTTAIRDALGRVGD